MNHVTDYLNRLDGWLEHDAGGSIPIDVLRERGFEIVLSSRLDDVSSRTKLWELIEALASIEPYLWATDHVSDRDRFLLTVERRLAALAQQSGQRGMLAYHETDNREIA